MELSVRQKDGEVRWDQIKGSTEEQAEKLELHFEGDAESLQFLGRGVYLA